MKQGTAKIQCTCVHEGQDKLHGNGVRIANTTAKGDPKIGQSEVRCTVCSKVHRINESKVR